MSESTSGATSDDTAAGGAEAQAGGEAGAGGTGGAPRQDIFSKLADAGEEVIARVAGMPGAKNALEQAQTALGRLDDLQKRVLGVEALERRVADLEARVAELESRSGSSVEAIGFES